MVVVGGVKQPDLARVFAHHQAVAGTDLQRRLAVASDAHMIGIGSFADRDRQFAAAVDHDRAVAQGMRTDRHQADRVEPGCEQGAAAGQGVRGRTRRRGDDQPVRTLQIDELAVHGGLELDHARHVPLVQNHVIEGQDRCLVPDGGGEEKTAVFDIVAGQDGGHRFEHVVRRNVDQKAQSAQIDADQRDIEVHELTRRAKECAVAADNESQITAFVEPFKPSGRGVAEDLLGMGVGHDFFAQIVQE